MPKVSKKKKYQLKKIQQMHEVIKRRKTKLPLQAIDQNISPTKAMAAAAERSNCKNVASVANASDSESLPCILTSQTSSGVMNTESKHVGSENDIELEMSHERERNLEKKHCGRRILNVSYFVKQLLDIASHGYCTSKELILIGEKQNGLISKFTFKCQMCGTTFIINNDCCEDNFLNINACAVSATVAIGCGQAQLEEFLSCINLPTISERIYNTNHDLISKHWEMVAIDSMQKAAKIEKEKAIDEGRINKDGIPIIDVIADGCWSKRSFKKNYSALSGAAAIIGKNTGQILYLGIRNKYCQKCAKTDQINATAKEHICFKNYDGPSTGMESQILVEGFKNSIADHNLIYGRLISDGDSSTYAKIIEARPYPDVTVEKIECRNHVLRNFCNKLQALVTDTKYPVKYRKFLTKKAILSTRAAICKAIKHNKTLDIQFLFEDILLSHLHAFGNHIKCKSYFCNDVGVVASHEKIPNDFFVSTLWQKICQIVQGVAAHARSLYHDVDSNAVENFHSIVAKFVGGKRINFSKKNSYKTRCLAAAVSFNEKRTVSRLYKTINQGHSPLGKLKLLENKRNKKGIINRRNRKCKNRSYKQGKQILNKDYGENCSKPDMDEDTLSQLKERFLENLNKTDEQRNFIQKSTILQSGSSEWLELRRSLLTASNFGNIIKRRQDTSCANKVRELLYKTNMENVLSIKHGRENEKQALAQLASEQHITITPCGLFIDKTLPYLGATPDGLCGDDTIVEVKCPITAHSIGITEAINSKKITFWKKDKTGALTVNTSHNWYYQVQGQLHVTQRPKCLFAVWANNLEPLKTELIYKDDVFWAENMEANLTTFYKDCILPELVDPRHPRMMPIRDPLYIQNAIQKKNMKKVSHEPQNSFEDLQNSPQYSQNTCHDLQNISQTPQCSSQNNQTTSNDYYKRQQQPTSSRYLDFDEF